MITPIKKYDYTDLKIGVICPNNLCNQTSILHLFTDALGKFFMGCCYVNNVPPVFYLNNPLKRIISHCPFLFILYEIEDILFMLLKIIAFQCHKPLSIPVSYLLARRTEDGKCLFIALSPFIKAFIH